MLTSRLFGLFLIILIVVFDQASKSAVLTAVGTIDFPIHTARYFNIVLVWNRGVSFGIMSDMPAWSPWLLTAGSCFVVLLLSRWFARASEQLVAAALALVIGGATANIIDRIKFGAVVDFLDFHYHTSHWPAFNIADSAIFIGVVILALLSIVAPQSQTKEA